MADPASALSVGALKRIFGGEMVHEPVFQCVQIKPMASNQNGTERWRVVFNDSQNFIQSMLAQRELP